MSNEPFGRQPLAVTITISDGADIDVEFWYRHLKRAAEYAGDLTQDIDNDTERRTFRIYPRAVND